MATSTTEIPTPPEVPNDQDGLHMEETVGHWGDLRLAHEGLMVAKAAKVNQYAFDAAEFARTGKWPERAATGEDDMSVNIGNKEYHYHYAAQTTAVNNEPAVPGAPVASAGSSVAAGLSSWLKPAAIVGASLVTGGVGATAVNLLWPDQPAQTAPGDTDTDTNSNLEIGD